jgi:MalT-like TPR region
LGRLHAAATAQGRTGIVIEIGALRALALAADGAETAAVDALAQALTLACPQGYVRVFADEGPAMVALLARPVAAQKADQACEPSAKSPPRRGPGGPSLRRCRAWSSS